MPDLLRQSAAAYMDLSRYAYTIIGGKNGKTLTASLSFPLDAYHHLAGFQYARLEALRLRKPALMNALDGRVTLQHLQDSGFSHFDRLQCIVSLRDCLESSKHIFRFLGTEGFHSKILADYLLQWDDVLFFFSDSCPVSIFRNTQRINYTQRSPRYTVLRITRSDILTGQSTIVYEW